MVIMKRRNKLWHRIRGAVDGYAVGIVRLIGESYSAETVQQAWMEFTVGAGQVFNGDDPHTELKTCPAPTVNSIHACWTVSAL